MDFVLCHLDIRCERDGFLSYSWIFELYFGCSNCTRRTSRHNILSLVDFLFTEASRMEPTSRGLDS